VVWADHDSFVDEEINYEDRETGEYHFVAFTAENIERAVVPLSGDLHAFVSDLVGDRLVDRLAELD